MRRADDAHKLNDEEDDDDKVRRLTDAKAGELWNARAVDTSNRREETQERRIMICSASSVEQQQPQPQPQQSESKGQGRRLVPV